MNKSPESIITALCLAILTGMMCLVFVGVAGRQVFSSHAEASLRGVGPAVNLEKLYPFENSESDKKVVRASLSERIHARLDAVHKSIHNYLTIYLPFYYTFSEVGKKYEQIVQWNLSSYGEYNSVAELSDGYYTVFVEKRNVTEPADSVVQLAEYCKERHIDFLYVGTFYKVNPNEDKTIDGKLDFSNDNADRFFEILRNHDVKNYDFRQVIRAENRSQHSLFFKTDHHWLPQTALWASRHLLEHLSEFYHFNTGSTGLEDSQFRTEVLPGWFLGSAGRKKTLAVVKPEDFTLFYPKYATSLTMEIPHIGYANQGDFSILYDYSQLDEIDYYGVAPHHSSVYDAYGFGQRPLIRVKNELAPNRKKVFLIRDSFVDAALPFLSLGIHEVDAVDLRLFTGSVRRFIEDEHPDMVIVMYTPVAIAPVDWSTHKDLFDFR